MNWNILGIEPTKDKKAITAAYRKQLRVTNPEDKPEEFKNLRAAYEEALAMADMQEPEADSTPVGKWIAEVEKVYDNMADRINPEKWQVLLQAEVCFGLDTRPEAMDALLKFFMGKYYLPKEIWQLLEESFHFTEQLEELKERYPIDFLENVILNGLRFDPALPYGLFYPGQNGADCDRYASLYFQSNRTAPENRDELLDQLASLSEHHPYGDVLCYCNYIAKEEKEKGIAGLRDLSQKYSEDSHIQLTLSSALLENGEEEEAEAIAVAILEKQPHNNLARDLCARCLASRGEYDQAKELLFENLTACDSDPILVNYFAEQLRNWNEILIPQRIARLEEHPEDMDNIIELAWCYLQNEEQEKAEEVAQLLRKDSADPYKYHNLMGKLCHLLEDYSESLSHLQTTEDLIRQMVPDGTVETKKRMDKLPEILQFQGSCLMQLGKNVEARTKFEEVVAIASENVDVLMMMAKILYSTGDFEYGVEILMRVNQLAPGAWHCNLLLALTLYRLRMDREAFDAINRAISTQVRDLSLYMIKIQILIRNEAWDEIRDILKFLKESGSQTDINFDFIDAQLLELETGDVKGAFAQYQKLARRVEAGEYTMWASDLYYRMAYVMADSMDMDKEDDRDLLIAMLDKGLAQFAYDLDCLNYKAWLLQRGNKIQEAVAVYKGILEKNKGSAVALQGLLRTYSGNMTTCAREALEFFEDQLSARRTAEMYFYAAECQWHLGNLEAAKHYFQMELEIDPDDMDAYNGLAYLCDAQGYYDESLKYLEQGIEAATRGEFDPAILYRHKVMILRRLEKKDEALAAASLLEQYDLEEMYKLEYEICCQFGDWNQAAIVLKNWKRIPGATGWAMAKGELYLLRGRPFRGSVTMTIMGKHLSATDIEDFQIKTQDLIGGYDLIVRILKSRAKSKPNDDFVLLRLAAALRNGGKVQESKKVAQKALEILDKTLEGNLLDEAMFRSRRSHALALLGRIDEARAELESVRKLPLCDYCPYSSCKDADIFEAEIEELAGNRQRALELFHNGRTKWPDDLDFIAGEGRIKRKGL